MSDTTDPIAIRAQAFRDAAKMAIQYGFRDGSYRHEEQVSLCVAGVLEHEADRLSSPPESEAEAHARVARGVADLLDPATVLDQLGGGNG